MYSFRIPGFRRPSLQTNQTTPGPAQPFRCLLWPGRREGGKKKKEKRETKTEKGEGEGGGETEEELAELSRPI